MTYGHGRYGYYRFGYSESEDRLEQEDEGYQPEEGGITDAESFGAGVALASQDDDERFAWDLVIDSTGALAATKGVDELAKDVAFRTAREYYQLIGGLMTTDTLADIERVIGNITGEDDRVSSVDDVTVSQRGSDTIDVSLEFTAEDDTLHEHVFPLSVN